MKKLLMLMLSAIMLLSITALAAAEVKVDGTVYFTYNGKDDDLNVPSHRGNDQAIVEVNITDKINKNWTGYWTYKPSSTDLSDNRTGKTRGDAFKTSEYYLRYKDSRKGEFKIGSMKIANTDDLDVLSALFSDLRGELGVYYNHKLGKTGFSTGFAYIPDYCNIKEETGDNAYRLDLKYKASRWDSSLYYIDKGEFIQSNRDLKDLKHIATEPKMTHQEGWAFNFGYTYSNSLRIYYNYERNNYYDNETSIFGTKYEYGPAWIEIEYDFANDYTKYRLSKNLGDQRYGFLLHYNFTKEFYTEYEYHRQPKGTDDDDQITFTLGVDFK
jgi:hypothetical protein